MPAGSASGGPGRWRGRARDAGVGGEVAEGGGEAMVEMFVRAAAQFLCLCRVLRASLYG